MSPPDLSVVNFRSCGPLTSEQGYFMYTIYPRYVCNGGPYPGAHIESPDMQWIFQASELDFHVDKDVHVGWYGADDD